MNVISQEAGSFEIYVQYFSINDAASGNELAAAKCWKINTFSLIVALSGHLVL